MSKTDTESMRASSQLLVFNPDRPTNFNLATPKKGVLSTPSEFAAKFNELNPNFEIKKYEGISVKSSQLRRASQ